MFDTYRHYIKAGTYLLELPVYGMSYDKESNTIKLKVHKYFLQGIETHYSFCLYFQTYETLMKEAKTLFDYRETRSRLIVIASVTKNYGDDSMYYCEIFNDAQLYFIESKELVKQDDLW